MFGVGHREFEDKANYKALWEAELPHNVTEETSSFYEKYLESCATLYANEPMLVHH